MPAGVDLHDQGTWPNYHREEDENYYAQKEYSRKRYDSMEAIATSHVHRTAPAPLRYFQGQSTEQDLSRFNQLGRAFEQFEAEGSSLPPQ